MDWLLVFVTVTVFTLMLTIGMLVREVTPHRTSCSPNWKGLAKRSQTSLSHEQDAKLQTALDASKSES
jgi:hypothetical protein